MDNQTARYSMNAENKWKKKNESYPIANDHPFESFVSIVPKDRLIFNDQSGFGAARQKNPDTSGANSFLEASTQDSRGDSNTRPRANPRSSHKIQEGAHPSVLVVEIAGGRRSNDRRDSASPSLLFAPL